MDLTLRYGPEADPPVLKVREGPGRELIDDEMLLGYDDEGKMVSVEIPDASKKVLFNAPWSSQGIGKTR